MTRFDLAQLLTGNEYRNEITKEQIQIAAQNKLVVVFGASDDLMLLRGAIMEECYERVLITKTGILEECTCHCKYYVDAITKAKELLAIWDPGGGYSWMFKTDIPHNTFEVINEGKPYCKGIVFSLNDV